MPRRNLLLNPSFETNVAYWTVKAVSSGTADALAREVNASYGARSGSYYLFTRRSTAGRLDVYADEVPVTPGQSYAGQVQVNRDGTGAVGLDIDWYTASDTYISSSRSADITPATATWATLTSVGVAPANAAAAQLYVRFMAQGAQQYVRVDAAMLEPATAAGTYADGDTAGWGWEGVAHASSSREAIRNECPSPEATTGWGGGPTSGTPAGVFAQNQPLNAGVMDGATAAVLTQSGLSGNARVTAAKKTFDADAGGQWWSATIQGWPEPPTNRCTNPVCATNDTTWGGYSGSGSSTAARVTGLAGMVASTGYQVKNTGAASAIALYSSRFPVTPGEVVSGTMQVRSSVATTGGWYLVFYNASEGQLGSEVAGPAGVTLGANTAVVRAVNGITVPAGAAFARVAVVTGTVATNSTLTGTGARGDQGNDSAMEYAQTLSCAAELVFRSSTNAQLAATVVAPSVTVPTGGPARVWASGQAPAGTRSVEVTFLARAAGARSKVWATAARLDQLNTSSLPYADGDTTGWAWDGTPGASASGVSTASTQQGTAALAASASLGAAGAVASAGGASLAASAALTPAPALTAGAASSMAAGASLGGSASTAAGLLWKADTDSSSASSTGTQIGYFGTQYQPGPPAGTTTTQPIQSNYTPIPVEAAPGGRPGRATRVTLPDNTQRYEHKPNHRSFDVGDSGYFFGFAFYLDADFPITGGDYQVIEQLHQAWGSWSPPVAFEIQQGYLCLTGGNGLPNGGTNPREFAHFQRLAPVSLQRWTNIVYTIDTFSDQTNTSRISVWIDGAPVLDRWVIPCPTIVQGDANDRLTYRKQGFYHRPSIPGGTIWHAGSALGTSYAAVDPTRQLASTTYQGAAAMAAAAGLSAASAAQGAAAGAALPAAAALGATATRTTGAAPALTASGVLAATATRAAPGSAALAADAALAGSGTRVQPGGAGLNADAALRGDGIVSGPGSVAMFAAAAFTAETRRTTGAAVALPAGGAFGGAGVRATSSPAVLDALAALAGSAVRTTPGAASLPGGATLGAAALIVAPGGAALVAVGDLAGAVRRSTTGAATLSAGADLAGAAVRSTSAGAGLEAAGAVAAAGTRITYGAASMAAAGALGAPAAGLGVLAAAALPGAGAFGGAALLILPAGAGLPGAGAFGGGAWLTERAQAALNGGGDLSSFAGLPSTSAAMQAAAALTGQVGYPIRIATAALTAAATLSGRAQRGAAAVAPFAASATLVVTAVSFTPAFIAPPAPRAPWQHPPALRLLAVDTVTGRVGYELPFSTLSWDGPLNGEPTGSTTLVVEAVLEHLYSQGAADPRLALREVLTGPYRYSFVVCWGGAALMGGPYLPSDDLAADSTIKAGFVGMERMLARRVLTNLDGSGGWSDASRDVVLERTTPEAAIYQIVASAIDTAGGDRPQRALPIVCSDPPRIAGEETFAYKSYDLVTAWKAITDITARDDGPDLRLDPMLVERGDGLYVQWDLEIGRPYLIGSGPAGPMGPLPFVFDDSASSISRSTDPVGMGTTFWGAGSGQDRDKVVVQATTTRLTDLGWPELETVSSSGSSETDDVKLTKTLRAAADAGSLPTDSWTLKARADGDPPRGAVRRGDPITIEALRTLLIEPGRHLRRVTKTAGSHDPWDDYTCDHEDALVDGDPRALGWRPDAAPSLVPAGTVVVPGSGGVADSGPAWLATTKASKAGGGTSLPITSPASATGQQLVLVGFTDTDGTVDGFTAPAGWSLAGASKDPHGGWGKVWTRLSTAADLGARYVTGQSSGRSCVLYCLAFNQPLAIVDLKFTGGGQNPATKLTAEAVGAGAGSIEVGMWAGYDETGSPAYTVPAGWSKTTKGDNDSGYETGTLAARTLGRGGQTDEAVATKTGAAVRWSAVTFALGTPVSRPAPGIARKVTNLTGPGFSDRYGVGGTDLGVPRPAPDGRLVAIFGDTFSDAGLTGDWRTPVALFADPAAISPGLRWIGAAPGPTGAVTYAGQLMPDPHNATLRGYYVTTQLPTDVVTIGSTMYLHVMACEGLGNVHFTELYQSTDNGQTWTSTGCWWDNGTNQNHMFEMVTLERGGDGYVYCISSTFSRDSGLQLRRVPEGQITTPSAWQTWGYANGKWAWGNPASLILTGAWGELCLRRLPSGRWLFSGFDAGNYQVSVRDLGTTGPTTDFTKAPVATLVRGCGWGEEDHTQGLAAQLYGGYLVPGSSLSEAHFVVSQWNTGTNWPYRSMQFRADLAAVFGGS